MSLSAITEIEMSVILEKLRSKVASPTKVEVCSTYNYNQKDLIVIKSHKVHDDRYTAVKICMT